MEMISFIKNKSIIIFLSALIITACGGEKQGVDNTTTSSRSLNSSSLLPSFSVSSSSSTSASAPVYSGSAESTAAVSSSSIKALSFSEAGPVYIAENEYFHNAASGNSDSVTYTSSNVNVATVTEEGYINVVNKGEVVITATQNKTSVNYSLIIVPKSVNFSVWLNGNNEKIDIPSELNDGELYISDSVNCTYSDYQGCRADQKYTIDGNTIIAAKDHSKSKPRVLFDNEYWALDVPNKENNIQPVVDHSVFVFSNKLWSIGGHSKNYLDVWLFQEYSNYIWSTIDGVNWTKETAKQQLPFLTQHQVMSFNNTLWLFGGTEHISDNDNWKAIYSQPNVWSSTDGINWIKVAENSASFFCGDTNLVIFKNKLWRFGGCDSSYAYSTVDGINWTIEATNPTLLNRSDHRVIVFNNKLLLIGGVADAQYRNDIWSSDDGVSWVLLKEHAEFSERQAPNLISFNNKLWLSGGRKGDVNYFDTWSSLDGMNWSQEGERSENGPLVFFKNEIWTIGGYDRSNVFEVLGTNATSKSSDGINWWHLDKRTFDFTRPYSNK